MKGKISVPIALGLIVSTSVYGFSLGSDNTVLLAQSQSQPDGWIVETKGETVLIKPKSMKKYSETKINNTALYLGDLLRVEKGKRVVVKCKDGTKWTVPDDNLPWGVANTCSPAEKKQAVYWR